MSQLRMSCVTRTNCCLPLFHFLFLFCRKAKTGNVGCDWIFHHGTAHRLHGTVTFSAILYHLIYPFHCTLHSTLCTFSTPNSTFHSLRYPLIYLLFDPLLSILQYTLCPASCTQLFISYLFLFTFITFISFSPLLSSLSSLFFKLFKLLYFVFF